MRVGGRSGDGVERCGLPFFSGPVGVCPSCVRTDERLSGYIHR